MLFIAIICTVLGGFLGAAFVRRANQILRGVDQMGVFDFFKKRKSELSREQKKWNKMWDLWAENRADTPYAEVMTYQSEVNNGGHDQYFFNVEQTGDLQAEISILENVLSEELRSNLLTAYDAYQMLADRSQTKNGRQYWNNATMSFSKTKRRSTAF